MLHKETVERRTLELLTALMQDEALKNFTLVGGTALALYLGHRKSVDLDLFSQLVFQVDTLQDHLCEKYGFTTLNTADVTLIGVIGDVKVDCIYYKYPPVEPVNEEEGIRLTSMPDIAAMKLTAISQSGTRLKDFVDVAFLSTKMSLNSMLDAFRRKFPRTNIVGVTKSLLYYDDIDFSAEIDLIAGKYNWKDIAKRLQAMFDKPNTLFLAPPLTLN
jgi:hypothetical protein